MLLGRFVPWQSMVIQHSSNNKIWEPKGVSNPHASNALSGCEKERKYHP